MPSQFRIPKATIGGAYGALMIAMYLADSEPLDGSPHDGLVLALGSIKQSGTVYRFFDVIHVDSKGVSTALMSTYALPASPTIFRDDSGTPVAVIPVTGTLYMQYDSASDQLLLSTSSYDDPEALAITDAVGPGQFPLQVGLGALVYKPGTLSGANAWTDNFRIDQGDIEMAPATVAAESAAVAAVGPTERWRDDPAHA